MVLGATGLRRGRLQVTPWRLDFEQSGGPRLQQPHLPHSELILLEEGEGSVSIYVP
jgi:hypothetical protein